MKNKNSAGLRKALYSVVILALVWSAFYLSDVPLAYAQASARERSIADFQSTGSSEALVSLSTDQESFGKLEDVIMHVAITNPHLEPIQVLKWFIPTDGMEESLFVVTRDGKPVPYLGPVYKRSAPTEDDYLTLQSGETLNGDVNLTAYYDFSVPGNYAMTYDVYSVELYARQEKGLFKMSGSLTSNEVKLFIEGRARPEFNEITPQVVTGSTSFTSCSASQQSLLTTARADASIYAADSLAYFTAGNTGNRYITWFGGYLLSRYNLVKSHFTNIRNAMDTASVHFDCSCNSSAYAYVYPNQPYNIYLCQAYWGAPATGTDSKAGTLIHEMSHFTILGGTNDWAYGQTAARNLAISDPGKAVTNADNHEYFAENTPPLVDPDSYESDNTAAQAKTISLGTTQTHSIVPSTDVDWVKFLLTSPAAVVLETRGNIIYDTRMWLYNSSLTEIRFSDDEGVGNYSYINTCDLAKLAAGTYYVKVDEFNNDNEIPAYTLSLSAGSNCLGVALAGTVMGTSPLYPGASTRQSFAGANNGPVQVWNIDGAPIIAAERVIYKVNGVNTSFSEMMGLPNSQLDTTYWLPWYNNVDLDTQLRFGNVSGSPASVHVSIGGAEMPGSPFTLGVGESTRVSFAGVNNGPVQIVSNVNIVAAERVIYKVNGINTSFSEMMALPNIQLDNIYWLPWYNNVDLDTQLRFGNVSNSPATVHVYIGGVEMAGSPFTLGVGESTRVSFAGVNNGPVEIVSNVDIVAAERLIYKVNGVNTSFSEMMALPASKLETTYWLPWYNNVDLDTQLRFGNVSNSPATVHVYIGGVEMAGSPFTLAIGASTRKSFAGVNNGPVQIISNVNIVAAERVIYKVNGVNTSFSEMMGLPNSQLNTTYWLPWYNNVDLDTQLRFGVP